MRNLCLFCIAAAWMLSGCATYLNGTYQKVAFQTDQQNGILVDGSEPGRKDGAILLKRDGRFRQITLTREGFKDVNLAVGQTRLSPMYVLSVVPFGVLFVPLIMDPLAARAYNYTPELGLNSPDIPLPKKTGQEKDIMLNKVGLDLKAEKIQFRFYPSYRYFLNGYQGQASNLTAEEDNFKLENTIFSHILNDLLKEQGYVDTTRKVFKRSYENNLLLNATVSRYRINQVNGTWSGSFLFVDLTVDWEVLDYYEQSVAKMSTEVTSGQFVFSKYGYNTMRPALEVAVEDALETGLIELMNREDMRKLLTGNERATLEAAFEPFPVTAGSAPAASVAEAAQSTVTVKTTDGHGSGFVVGGDGFIITNHHVVLDTVKPKVILPDGSEYEADIIRESLIYDLALLKINASGLKPLKVSNSKDFELASEVYVIGTPTAEDLPQTISRGIVSGIRTPRKDSRLIQTDASVNGGNSGGPIVNSQGEVIAVVSTKVWGFGIEGVAFGIPAYEIMDRLKLIIQ